MQFNKLRKKFGLRGIQLSRPVDLLEENKYAAARNIRSYIDGVIESRPGMALVYDVDTGASSPVHTIKRLNDAVNARSTYFTGAGTKLYADNSGHTAATEIDSGYSGDPISTVPHRPDQSPLPWLYFMDRTRGGRKAKSTAASDTFKSYPQGVAPPTTPPVVSLAAPLVKVVSEFDTAVGWAQAGTAGVPALMAGKRVDTTITYILFDAGSTGNASINPTTLSAQLQAGMRLVIDAAGTPETVTVEDVFPAITTTTISSVIYDNAPTNTGPCTVVLTAPSAELRKDSMIRIAAAENVRVLSVIAGPQGITSFRCSTVGTRAAGDAVAGLASFRVYCTANHVATNTLTDEALESTVTEGTGTLTFAGALDLSISGARPITAEDYMLIGVRVDKPQLVTEIKVRLDVADATNDFTKDFYEKSFRASDLTAAIQATTPSLTVEQQVLQRDQIDQPADIPIALENKLDMLNPDRIRFTPLDGGPSLGDPTLTQLGLGSSVWSALQWQLKESDGFRRIGTDAARNLKNVASIQIVVICTGTVVVDLDSWYIRGGYALDVQGAYWAYRYRSLETKARSNLGPPTRSPLDVTRGSVTVACDTKDTRSTGDPQVTVIDVYRFDDVLEDYTYVGSVANPSNAASTTATFTDEFSDETVQLQGDLKEGDQFQPFPLSDLPRSGVVNVKGTEVSWVSGDTFNTAWGRGSKPLKINGILCTLYTNPSSSTVLSLNENLGTLTNATLEFPEPLLLGQPRPVMWGPYGGGTVGIFFFSVYLGTLLWTNANNPDAASDANQLEITNPSEPLVNGYLYDGRPYVCSTERTYEVGFNGVGFIAKEVANSQGLAATWGVCVLEGGKIYKVARDGIYESEGGQDYCITDDLSPIFPQNGVAGFAVNGFLPLDYSVPEKMQLSGGDGVMRFKYQDTGGTQRCLVFDVGNRSWVADDFTPRANTFYAAEGQSVHGELVGSIDGKLYRSGGTDDNGVDISCALQLPAFDVGSNNRKLFHDLQFDLNTNSQSVTLAVSRNSYSTPVTPTPAVLTNASRGVVLVDLNSGAGVEALDLGLTLSWSKPGVQFFEYVIAFFPRPTDALSWLLPPTTFGYHGFFQAKEMWIAHESTEDLTLRVYWDGVESGPIGGYVITNANGVYTKQRVILRAGKGKSFSCLLTGDESARAFAEDVELLTKDWGSDGGYQIQRPLMEPSPVG